MATFEVIRKIVGFDPHYDVVGDEGAHAVVRGKILAVTPKLTMTAGEDGPEIATLIGNFLKTRFECTANGRTLATLFFKMVAVKRDFTIRLPGQELKAEGRSMGLDFQVRDRAGTSLMSISQQMSLRDRFEVTVSDPMPWQVAVMTAVAVAQQYFSDAEIAAAIAN